MNRKSRIIWIAAILFLLAAANIGHAAKERQGIVTLRINLPAQNTSNSARLWLPYPLSDEHQRIENLVIKGSFDYATILNDEKNEAIYHFSEWQDVSEQPSLEMSFRVRAAERMVKELKDSYAPIPEGMKRYLEPNWWIATDGEIKKIADSIIEGKKGVLAKSRAVYDWVVENTERDPRVRGCGLGIVEQTLIKRSGKCADISSVYIALARAAGVPSREVFGIRLGKEAEEDITGGYHCWAEFFLPGTGWVPVDPADVRKIMLVQNLTLTKQKAIENIILAQLTSSGLSLEKLKEDYSSYHFRKASL